MGDNTDDLADGIDAFWGGQFNDTPVSIADNPAQQILFNHNTEYHLRRYVGREEHAFLQAQGVVPGNYDAGLVSAVLYNLNLVFDSDATLHDVRLMSNEASSGESIVAYQTFDALTLSQLATMNIHLSPGDEFSIIAASTPGGPADVTLTTGNPFAEGTSIVELDVTSSFSLVLADANEPSGFRTLADGTLHAMNLPQPEITPGDYNGDGFVDAADYTLWRDTLGLTGSGLVADGNGDGMVNQADYGVWRANFGASSAGLNNGRASVPEPSALLLLGLSAMQFSTYRRRV